MSIVSQPLKDIVIFGPVPESGEQGLSWVKFTHSSDDFLL
jgi:hypothetical protein